MVSYERGSVSEKGVMIHSVSEYGMDWYGGSNKYSRDVEILITFWLSDTSSSYV